MKFYFFLILFFQCIFSFGQVRVVQNATSPRPFVLGEIQVLDSKILGEKRILNIYLPDGYKTDDTVTYPVVYLLDGGADEDFIHVVGLYQFNSFPWINRVPKSIIVGIANIDRKKDFTYPTSIENDRKKYPTTGHSENFIKFIEEELQPFISNTYKTNSSKTIIGESLGGLLATEILFKNPELFNTYIIISPSLWWDNGSLLNIQSVILQKNFTELMKVYVGVGKEGLVTGDFPHVMEVDANLLADKLKTSESGSLKVYFDYLPEENHATVAHQAVFDALKILYPMKELEK
ncbi:MAG: alpha/beta hydrolase-fold protein [Saprospiraceae bacterium]